eukprot:3105959-Pyramimonas_sp.AAC.1
MIARAFQPLCSRGCQAQQPPSSKKLAMAAPGRARMVFCRDAEGKVNDGGDGCGDGDNDDDAVGDDADADDDGGGGGNDDNDDD